MTDERREQLEMAGREWAKTNSYCSSYCYRDAEWSEGAAEWSEEEAAAFRKGFEQAK